MTFISYAQNFEDVMLWRALKHVERGFYIDVGAFSPDLDSVTRAFSERGWRGINVEPNPPYLAQLNERRPHDLNLGIAVSDFDGEIELSVVADTGLTTVDSTIARGHADAGWALSRIKVPTRTLTHLWDEYVPEGQAVHFLKIDVEGHEAAVLRGADWSRHRPWVVVVESTIPNTQISTHVEWEERLTQADYRFAYWDGLNRFYVAAEHAALAEAFTEPPNVFDRFVIHGHASANERAAELEGSVSALSETLRQLVRERDNLEARLGGNAEMMSRFEQERDELKKRLDSAEYALSQRSEVATMVGRELREVSRVFSHEIAIQRHMLHLVVEETRVSHRRLEYILCRSIWERLLLRPSGRPRKPFRVMLFHASGKPRGVFRRWVLRRDGQPRRFLRMWMTSAEYQKLRYPTGRRGIQGMEAETEPLAGLSPRGRYFSQRLEASRSYGRDM